MVRLWGRFEASPFPPPRKPRSSAIVLPTPRGQPQTQTASPALHAASLPLHINPPRPTPSSLPSTLLPQPLNPTPPRPPSHHHPSLAPFPHPPPKPNKHNTHSPLAARSAIGDAMCGLRLCCVQVCRCVGCVRVSPFHRQSGAAICTCNRESSNARRRARAQPSDWTDAPISHTARPSRPIPRFIDPWASSAGAPPCMHRFDRSIDRSRHACMAFLFPSRPSPARSGSLGWTQTSTDTSPSSFITHRAWTPPPKQSIDRSIHINHHTQSPPPLHQTSSRDGHVSAARRLSSSLQPNQPNRAMRLLRSLPLLLLVVAGLTAAAATAPAPAPAPAAPAATPNERDRLLEVRVC